MFKDFTPMISSSHGNATCREHISLLIIPHFIGCSRPCLDLTKNCADWNSLDGNYKKKRLNDEHSTFLKTALTFLPLTVSFDCFAVLALKTVSSWSFSTLHSSAI